MQVFVRAKNYPDPCKLGLRISCSYLFKIGLRRSFGYLFIIHNKSSSISFSRVRETIIFSVTKFYFGNF